MGRKEGREEFAAGATDYQRFTDTSSNIQNLHSAAALFLRISKGNTTWRVLPCMKEGFEV
jgi:hypothetical protein